MTSRTGKSLAIVVAVLALVAGACGDDDGAAVRESGDTSGSAGASGSASGAASGSGTASGASGSGTASGTAAEECEIVNGSTEETENEIHAEMTEYAIDIDKTEIAGGLVKFEVENAGEEEHEIAVVRGDDPAALPKAADGSVDDGDLLVGEIEPFAGGTSCEATFQLDPGGYVLLCNIVEEEDDGTTEAHFAEGMFTTLTVTG
jgi:hypothetical protein